MNKKQLLLIHLDLGIKLNDITEWNLGGFIDGRGRTTGALNRNERWIPVAVYDRDDFSVSSTVTNGIKGNLGGRPQRSASFRDIVNGGVHLVNEGELKPTVIYAQQR